MNFKSGTFWMVYDTSECYLEYTLCPTRNWALDVKQDNVEKYPDGKWRIFLVKVEAA